MALRLLHLSDVHFSHKVDDDRVKHLDVRRKLLEDAAGLRRDHGDIAAIIVAGDVAFSGNREEYVEAFEWLEELAKAVGCHATSVLVVPGNHDVDISRVTPLTKQLHTFYRGLPDKQLHTCLTQLGASAEESFLVEKVRDYHDFASAFGCEFIAPSRPMWTKTLELASGRYLRFVGLSSVQISDLNDHKGGLVLGANQYILEESDSVELVAVFHHPLVWLKDQTEAERYLNTRARIIISGHEHSARATKSTDEADCDRLVIESGAVTPPDAHSPYTYKYNLLELDLIASQADQELVVKVFGRAWSHERPGFVADNNRLRHGEHSEFRLRCSRYSTTATAAAVKTIETDGRAVLRYNFWRFLTWNERISTLAKLKLLPKSKSSPVTQRIEHEAFALAEAEGKLRDLWDEVNAYVPLERRSENPFPPRH